MENETVEQKAIRIIMALRDLLGPDVKGVSKEREALIAHDLLEGITAEDFNAAALYAQRQGWVRVRDAIGRPAFSIVLMETGQRYLDHLGL